jgi:ParB family chromosome partitioning protein
MSETSRGKSRRRFSVDALFEDTRPQASGVADLTEAKVIDLNRIVADPDQPRRTFDPDRLEELADSIRVEGVLQPIVVRFEPSKDHYVVVHGERRWRASQAAGLTSIPAIVKDVPVERRLVQQLMENVVRDDLNAVDRAAALRALRSQLGNPPWEDVAAAVGIKRSRLFQLLGTEKLAPAVQEDIRSGVLSEKQSRVLQGLPPDRQAALHSYLLSNSLAVSETTRLARAYREADALDGESAEDVLDRVQAFVFAVDSEQLQSQSRTLFRAIRDARTGTSRGRQRLSSLNAVLNAGKHRDERMAQDINRLAKSLAALAASSEPATAMDPDLRELRDTLDSLLS